MTPEQRRVRNRAYKRRQREALADAPLTPRACRCEGKTPTTTDEDGARTCLMCGHWTPETLALAEGVFV